MSFFFAAASSPSSEAEFALLFWAMIGGIMVFSGLGIEKIADWMNETFLDRSYKPHKTLGELGWCILMFGILVEIAVAGWSANDAWQTRQIAIKIDPRNQPIFSVSGYALILARPLEPVESFNSLPQHGINELGVKLRSGDLNNPSKLELGRLSASQKWLADVTFDNITRSICVAGSDRVLRFDLYFGEKEHETTASYKFLRVRPLTVNNLDAIWILMSAHCEIITGRVEMTINGSIQKDFQIPKQTVRDNITSAMTNDTFIPIKVVP